MCTVAMKSQKVILAGINSSANNGPLASNLVREIAAMLDCICTHAAKIREREIEMPAGDPLSPMMLVVKHVPSVVYWLAFCR